MANGYYDSWVRRLLPWIAPAGVAALVAYTFVARLRFLGETPFPTGVDGYYYAIQVRALLAHGHLAYPTAPLVLWLMALVAKLGASPIVATKLVAAGGTALAPVPAYLLARRFAGQAAAFLAAALTALSASSFYLATEFVKQGVGLTIAGFAIVAAAAAIEQPTRLRIAGAALLLVACDLAHKEALGIAILVIAPALLVRARRIHWLVLAGAAAIVLVAGALAPHRFLGGGDLQLFGRIFRARFDASGRPRVGLAFRFEVLQGALLALAAIGICKRELPRIAVGLVVCALVLWFPFLDDTGEQTLTLRLRVAAFLPMAPLAALVVERGLGFLAAETRRLFASGAALAFVAILPSRSSEGLVTVHPAMVQAIQAAGDAIPDGALVAVPERHLVFMLGWYSGRQAQLSDEGADLRLLPRPSLTKELRAIVAAPLPGVRGVHPFASDGLVLFTNDAYAQAIARLPPAQKDRYRSWRTLIH
jgi:hypothetical protein